MTRPDVLPRATEHIDEMVALIGTLLEREPRLPDRRRLDLLPDRLVADLRPAGAARSRATSGRRTGGGGRVRQGRCPRLRAVEGRQAGRAVVDDGHRRGSARLAHRMLGDEHGPPRDVVRHPHRRHRPDLPAPRGRDRPERSRDRPAVRQHLAALRAPAVERHEDGQVDGEHRPAERAVRGGRVAAGAALRAARRALPSGPQPLGRIAGRGGGGAVTPGRARRGAGGLPRGSVGRRDAAGAAGRRAGGVRCRPR